MQCIFSHLVVAQCQTYDAIFMHGQVRTRRCGQDEGLYGARDRVLYKQVVIDEKGDPLRELFENFF